MVMNEKKAALTNTDPGSTLTNQGADSLLEERRFEPSVPPKRSAFANRLLPALPVGKSCRFEPVPGIGARFALVSG